MGDRLIFGAGHPALHNGWTRSGLLPFAACLLVFSLSILAPLAQVNPGPVAPERSRPLLLDTLHPVPGLEAGKLPIYELKMSLKDLERLENSDSTTNTYPATFMANGVVYENVGVRFRGQWARTWPKKPLK